MIKIVARLKERAGSNLLVASACALASWTRTNITARHSMQRAVDRKVAILLVEAAVRVYLLFLYSDVTTFAGSQMQRSSDNVASSDCSSRKMTRTSADVDSVFCSRVWIF